jgi:hypothetical protein
MSPILSSHVLTPRQAMRLKRYSSAICPFSQRAIVAIVEPSTRVPVTAVQSPAPIRIGWARIW